jgi:hypothetical protein
MHSLKILLAISLLLISKNIIAQRVAEKCILITQQGDTLNGLLDNKQWFENPDTIEFKSDSSNAYVKFSPKEIKSIFTESNIRYVGVTMPIDFSPYRLNELTKDSFRVIKVASVFLQTLVSLSLIHI